MANQHSGELRKEKLSQTRKHVYLIVDDEQVFLKFLHLSANQLFRSFLSFAFVFEIITTKLHRNPATKAAVEVQIICNKDRE